MSSLLARLKAFFKRKKEEQPQTTSESPELKFEQEKPAVVPVKKVSDERQQKICPHCGVENDHFVNKCWLCKKEM
jgi:hypothetical protein